MKKYYRVILQLIIFSLLPMFLYSQSMPVPAKLQAAIYKKVFNFDKTLKSKGDFEVYVVGEGGVQNEVVKEFNANGIKSKAVSPKEFKANPSATSVVFICPGIMFEKSLYSSNSILSLSADPVLVNGGNAAISLDNVGGKPKIIVNLPQLKSENHEISANLLKLAKVIK